MKKRTSYLLIAFAMGSTLLCGCKESIDLKNIDPKMEAKLGLALPVGSMKFTMNDFLGHNEVQQLYFNADGVLSFRDTFSIQRSFHDIDLAKYISETTKHFKVKEKVPTGEIIGDGTTITTLNFPLTLTLNGMNKISTLSDERIDSAIITNATFISNIDRVGFEMEWDWIESVDVVLGDEFTRSQGKQVRVYDKVRDQAKGYGWQQDIPITIDTFSICLMKDRNGKGKDIIWYSNNVIDSCKFNFIFKFKVPQGTTVHIDNSSYYEYKFKVNFIDYHAIWGYFAPSNKMRDCDTVDIAKEWPTWSYFKQATLPFAHPRVDLFVTTQLAGALIMTGDYMYVKNNRFGKIVYATFDEGQSEHQRVEHKQCVTLDAPIGDSVTIQIPFTEAPTEGHIDNLFAITPDEMGYSYHIDMDLQKSPQARINKHGTDIRMQAVADVPFIFNEGLNIDYQDTVRDVDLSSYTLDSLLAQAKILDTVKTSDLYLVLTANNSLPMRIMGVPKFLDKAGQEIKDPSDPTHPIRFSTNDTLIFNAPTKYEQTITGLHIEPGISTFILAIDKQHFDEFAHIKNIQLHAMVDNSSMIKGVEAPITNESYLKVKIGIAANVDAIVNLEKSNK